MPVPPDGGFYLAQAAIETLRNLTSIIDKSKKENTHLSHSEAIQKMGADVHARAKDLRDELREMEKNLNILADKGYDIDKPLSDVRKQGWFYKIHPFSPYKMLRNFGTRVGGVSNQIQDLFSDVVAVANCREAEDQVAAAVAESQKQIDGLGSRATNTVSMRNLVDLFLTEADELVELTSKL